uniref:Transposase n=1 Tax=Globodera rostochiensis TaxID=31243 RepID=A0A914I2Z5_GLORO
MATNRRYTQKEYEAKIKQKLGYTILTIKRWKRNFGIHSKYKNDEKMKVVQRYHQIKGANPRLRDIDIAKMLHIGARTLYSWRHQFEDKGVQMQGSDSFLNGKGSH